MFRYGAIALSKVHLYAILLLVLKYYGYRITDTETKRQHEEY